MRLFNIIAACSFTIILFISACSNEPTTPNVPDPDAPVIIHINQTDVTDTSAIILTAQVIDDDLFRTVLYYRIITSTDSTNWILIEGIQDSISNDIFHYSILGQLEPSLVEYYIAAIDEINHLTTIPEGGAGNDPPGNIPPPIKNKFNVILDGIDLYFNEYQSFQVASIFVKSCATSGCHAGFTSASGLALLKHSELMAGSTNRSGGTIPNYGGDVVIPFRTTESLLYQFIEGNVTPIAPHDAINLTQNQKDILRTWIENGAMDNAGNVSLQTPSYNVYVCNQNSDKVSIINGDAKVVSGIIDVDYLQSIDSPHMVKERGNYIYVTLIASAKFLKIDKTTKQIVSAIDNITKAGMIQISPDGTKAYVSRSSTSDPIFNSVYVIDLNAMAIINEILFPAPGVPHGMGLKPDGTKLYVANLSLDRIHIVNGTNDEYIDDIVLDPGTQPMQAAVSPDGNFLYVSARGTAKLLVFDTAADTMIAEVDVSHMPMQIAITSNGEKIYLGSMMMSVVDVVRHQNNTWVLEKSISHPGFSRLHGCDITADDKYVYVSSRNEVAGGFKPYFEVTGESAPGTIGIIDTQTDEVVKLIEIELFGSGLVVEK